MRNETSTDTPFEFFPHLDREDRKSLVAKLEVASSWTTNFGVLLGSSVVIASLGLLQNSSAVVIGAMLVAPLMTPLIAAGLALVQGNLHLLRESATAMLGGITIGLLIAIAVESLVPRTGGLTLEITSRGSPNILDLFIAFFAGLAAAYAVTRPSLSGALPGVAISVALVPPLAACGIALGAGEYLVAQGAGTLFTTNLVAIILGSALVFWGHGLGRHRPDEAHPALNRTFIAMLLAGLLLAFPLSSRLGQQLQQGQVRPSSFPLRASVYDALDARVRDEAGVQLMEASRAGSEGPADVTIVLVAASDVDRELVGDLQGIISAQMGDELETRVVAVQSAAIKTEAPAP